MGSLSAKNASTWAPLKGPKHEIFSFGFCMSIKPVWKGDLGTRTKDPKLGWIRPENFVFFSAVGYSAKDF
jgi:hypothetical protein